MSEALPWIQVATALPLSDEADALEEMTGVDRAWTHLVELWCWVGMTRPDGDLAGLSPRRIAKRASWPEDPDVFVKALKDLGWLVEDEAGLKFRGWDKRYKATIEKRKKDRARQAKRRSGDVAATSDATRTDVAEVSTGKRREEKRREEKIPPSGGAGGEPAAAPPPAAPEPPPAKPKKPKASRRAKSHATLAELLNECPEGEHLGKKRDGTTPYVEIWRRNFSFIEHFHDELRGAWDHDARRKRTDMVLYMVTWLRRSNEQAQANWQRRPENRPSFDEMPGGLKRRAEPPMHLAPPPPEEHEPCPGCGSRRGVDVLGTCMECDFNAARTPEAEAAAADAFAAMKGRRV